VKLFSILRTLVRDTSASWRDLALEDLQFWHRDTAQLALIGLLALSFVLLVARSALRRRPGRYRIALPAVLSSIPESQATTLRHAPIPLFVLGLPFMMVALADPYSSLVRQDVSFPGRRISIMIDASTSMQALFTAETVHLRSPTEASFFTTVAAAERFIRLRMNGKYRDLIALVEFGNQAYVITPFTNDYDNILLSTSLIGDPGEFALFPDPGTVVARAIEQSIALFKAFDFLEETSGNVMVIFTDGQDTVATVHGRSLDDILQSAVDNKIPLYFVRTMYDQAQGGLIPDALWKSAVERTGGKFYAASDEASLLKAIHEIDSLATGTIRLRRYSSQESKFSFFATMAAALWTAAAALKLSLPYFQKLP
jgi:Ca-activated chloride channel family protein